jgi:L-ascorbate oxidase
MYKIKAREGTARPPATVDWRIVMLNTQNLVGGHAKWAINHATLSLPRTPYLGAYIYGIKSVAFDAATESPDNYDRGYNVDKPPVAQAPAAQAATKINDRVYKIKNGTVVDVILQNTPTRSRMA